KILQDLRLPQARGYGGFPISGKWLVCDNKNIIQQHKGKVYSQAETGSPPMSVPHLDIRNINGKQSLLFGPFAGFTFKFLKSGSFLDFPSSIKISNLKEILTVGIKNLNLLTYLIKQALQNHKNRMKHLRKFYPEAKSSDWKLISAGQRVQIIKPSDGLFGKLEFGTEIIYDHKKTLAALLGASPGASVSAASMLEIVEKCFLNQNQEYTKKLKKIFPSYGIKLNDNPKMLQKVRNSYRKILKLL
ncbi:malate:quinone oxidoreductase, partial [Methylophilaceae bacterium]|nr:malate:quinone oxidoreductase [Methylophilaceae bacterium]